VLKDDIIIPKPLHIAANFKTQTDMSYNAMVFLHQPTQEQINELGEKED
jgi:hypothetical protein